MTEYEYTIALMFSSLFAAYAMYYMLEAIGEEDQDG